MVHVSLFTFFYRQTSPCILPRTYVFFLYYFQSFMKICNFPLHFLPPPVIPVVPVSISLYFPELVVYMPSFIIVAFFWGPLFGIFWSFLNPFPYCWCHECVHLCCVLVCYVSPGYMLKTTSSPIGSVYTPKFGT